MSKSKILKSIIAVLLIHSYTFGQPNQPSLDIQILDEPERVMMDGNPTIYYELRVTNYNDNPVQLSAVEAIRSKDGDSLFSVSKKELNNRYAPIGSNDEKEAIVASGSSAILYLEFPVPEQEHFTVLHRIKYKIPEFNRSKTFVLDGVDFRLNKTKPAILGSPLKGGPWAAIHNPSWERGHRRVIYTKNGAASIPGRFAIDFVKLNDRGLQVSGDKNFINNWYGYGAPVLAVADGVVAAMRDDFTESETLSGHPKYSPEDATGNYIAIDIGNGKYVFYEHLKPSSIKVEVGQKIKKGEVIASLGFTGQSTGPHLHLHLADRNSPLGAEGIPFVFEHFNLLGSYENFELFGKERWQETKRKGKIVKEHPAPNTVIYFEK